MAQQSTRTSVGCSTLEEARCLHSSNYKMRGVSRLAVTVHRMNGGWPSLSQRLSRLLVSPRRDAQFGVDEGSSPVLCKSHLTPAPPPALFFFFRSFLALSRRASDLPRTPQDADKLNRHFRALSRRKTSSTDTFPRASEIKTRNLQASKAPTHFWIRTLRAYTLACVSPLENSS